MCDLVDVKLCPLLTSHRLAFIINKYIYIVTLKKVFVFLFIKVVRISSLYYEAAVYYAREDFVQSYFEGCTIFILKYL